MTQQEQEILQQIAAAQKQGGIANLAPALVQAWAAVGSGVKKNANNPAFRSEYATLEAVLEVVKKPLADNGLALIQAPGVINADGIEVHALLIHKSGELVTFKTVMPLGGKLTAQSAGSAVTYGRRYQLMALFGLAPSDDDGNAASGKSDETSTPIDDGSPEVDTVLEAIEAATTVEQLEKEVRPTVENLGDPKVNKAYVARKRALKQPKGN